MLGAMAKAWAERAMAWVQVLGQPLYNPHPPNPPTKKKEKRAKDKYAPSVSPRTLDCWDYNWVMAL